MTDCNTMSLARSVGVLFPPSLIALVPEMALKVISCQFGPSRIMLAADMHPSVAAEIGLVSPQ